MKQAATQARIEPVGRTRHTNDRHRRRERAAAAIVGKTRLERAGSSETISSPALTRDIMKDARMKLAPRLTATRPESSHRIYRDPAGGTPIACRLLGDNDLMALAANADQIEIRQALGSGWIPPVAVDRLVQALRALGWAQDEFIPDADDLRREIRGQVVDALARIKVRYARHVLAGVTHRMADGRMQCVLVLVLARRVVRSCEWHLAA
jgi:hypothetical protein